MAAGRQVSAEPVAKRLHLDSQGRDREKPLRMAWAFEMTGTKMTVFLGGRTDKAGASPEVTAFSLRETVDQKVPGLPLVATSGIAAEAHGFLRVLSEQAAGLKISLYKLHFSAAY